MDLQPEGGASKCITGYYCTSGFEVRVQAGAPAYQQKWRHTSSLVPSLKTFRDLPSSRVASDLHHSTKQSLLPVLSVCLFLETYIFLDTGLESRNWRGSGGVKKSGRMGGWDRGSSLRCALDYFLFFIFFGATPALRAPAPPTTPLTCALIYLSSVGNPMLSLILKVTQTLRQLERKHNMLLNHRSDTDVGQGPPKRVELANLSLKKNKGLG